MFFFHPFGLTTYHNRWKKSIYNALTCESRLSTVTLYNSIILYNNILYYTNIIIYYYVPSYYDKVRTYTTVCVCYAWKSIGSM